MPSFAEVASRPDPKTPLGVAIRPFRTPSPCEYAKLWAWFAETKVQSHSNGPLMEPARVTWEMSEKLRFDVLCRWPTLAPSPYRRPVGRPPDDETAETIDKTRQYVALPEVAS